MAEIRGERREVLRRAGEGDRCDPAVAAWWSGVAEDDLWLSALVLPVDTAVAEEWSRMNATRPMLIIDALLAATVKANGLTLMTRN